MTDLVNFVPPPTSAFQFTATLDGAAYSVTVTWNVMAQRWYITIQDQNNVRIVTIPMIGSPPFYDISLTAGYFDSTLIFREVTQQFEIAP